MHIYQPFFLASAVVPSLAGVAFSVMAVVLGRRRSPDAGWIVPFYASMSVVFLASAAGQASHAFDVHGPSTRTLMVFAVAAGILLATILNTIVAVWVNYKQGSIQNKANPKLTLWP